LPFRHASSCLPLPTDAKGKQQTRPGGLSDCKTPKRRRARHGHGHAGGLSNCKTPKRRHGHGCHGYAKRLWRGRRLPRLFPLGSWTAGSGGARSCRSRRRPAAGSSGGPEKEGLNKSY
jgi:hypothetical protein